MPRFVNDGNTKVAWGTFADKNFPAVSELLAAEDIECLLTGDGLNTNFSENEVDDSALCEPYDATLPGTYKAAPELTLKRQTPAASDTAWNLFSTRGESGALVVREGTDSDTAWAAGQKVQVYPGAVGVRRPAPPARNEQAKFMITLYTSEEPALDATVVAS